MGYANVFFRPGPDRFARELAEAGVRGVIIPDLPVDELDEWSPAAEQAAGVPLRNVLLTRQPSPQFAARAIDLTKLESRPTKRSLGDYCFFIDFEGHVADEVVAEVANVGAGHYLPTTPTPAAWLEIALLDAKGKSLASAKQRIGRDIYYDTEWHERADTRIPLMYMPDGVRALLETEGMLVVGSEPDAASAVSNARRTKPDVVLMDVRLEGASGIEACREIRSLLPDTKVLMLTSYADEDAVLASILAGASHELRSPLARMRMAVELLPEDVRPELRSRLAHDIAELDALIGELLLASRLDASAHLEAVEEVEVLAVDVLATREELGGRRALLDGRAEPADRTSDHRLDGREAKRRRREPAEHEVLAVDRERDEAHPEERDAVSGDTQDFVLRSSSLDARGELRKSAYERDPHPATANAVIRARAQAGNCYNV